MENKNDTAVALLKALRQRVKKNGWVQGNFVTPEGSCLIGHLNALVEETERQKDSPYEKVLLHIIDRHPMTQWEIASVKEALTEIVGLSWTPLQYLQASVVMINEKRCMEKEDILELLR